ncbi:MAG: DNA gyrase subunit A [Chloroflexi bacterium]|nr:MAG: DNA gyrase subunit A [Chloroflexota bacterium]MCE7860033.1 DNA gyrase subunit A [Chloroflexi bacterium CFX2]
MAEENLIAGNIESVDIDEQMRSAYLDYAMSVIVARALPDARDGMKPVHRRILYAMHELGLRSNSSFKKSARIVGEVLGKYHPHGDSAVYESMARMAQDFSMRYMLVDGQGNFGSVDGDAPAAMRYTEARLQKMAEEMLADLDKETVDFGPNFDDSLQEPLVLPARLPNLLLNGASGIAVGMATNIPPQNLRELAGAITHLIDNYDKIEDVTVEDLMKYVQGPDFPTGGMIVGTEGINSAYSTGRGRIVMRGIAHIEEEKGGKYQINITEIPYQVNKSSLIERIAELVREGKIDQISDLRDESDKRGMSIVIELKRGAQPKKVLNQLYKYTALQSTFGVQMLALVDGEPRTLPLKRLLQIFIDHRQTVITRRSRFELDKAKARLHILDGYLIALNNIDAIIKTIRNAEDADKAKTALMTKFKLSELQAQAILDMQLRRLAALERWKIEEEHKQVRSTIDYLEDLLANPKKILALIKGDMNEVAEKYGDDRRTRISAEAKEDIHDEDLVPDESVLISLTERGYVKRVAASAFRQQSRGGRGVKGHTTKEEDEVVMLIPARSLDTMLFFTDKGKVYSEKVYQIPDLDRATKGIPLVNILALGANEKVTAAMSIRDFSPKQFCMMMTARGRAKRVSMEEFESVRPSGLIAVNLDEGDTLGWARLTSGKDEIIIVTENGQALRFSEEKVRAMGRQAAGVQGIRLKKGDVVTSMDVVNKDGALLVVTTGGFGKQTPLKEYAPKGRATGGIATIDQKALKEIGKIAAARVVQKEDDLTIMTANGVVIRLKVKDVKQSGRATKGVHLIKPQDGDSVASVARISADDLKKAGAPMEDKEAEPQPKLV